MPNTIKIKQIDQAQLTAFINKLIDGTGAVYAANKALVTNSSGDVVVSSVTSTELGYLSGVSSAVQTQLSNKLSLSGGTLTASSSSSNILVLQQTGDPYTGGALRFLTTEGYSCNVRFEQDSTGAFHPLIFDFGANGGYLCGIQMRRNGVEKLWLFPDSSGARMRSIGTQFMADHDFGSYVAEWLKYDGVVNLGGLNAGGVKIWDHTALRQKFTAESSAAVFYNYYTYTDDSNYQAAKIFTTSTSVTFGAVTAGTGGDNIDVILSPAGAGRTILEKAVLIGSVNRNATFTSGDIGLNVNSWLSAANGTTVKRIIAYESSYGGCIWIDPDSLGTVFSNIIALGGLHASYPALKRNGSELQALLGDSSAFTTFACKGLGIKEGSNAKMGIATLVDGTVTVSTTAVTANSRIYITAQNLGTITIPVGYAISDRNAGSDFTILSANSLDTSEVSWIIIEPAS